MAVKGYGSNTEYTRSYRGFSGVMLGGGSVSSGRLAEAVNMYRDYDGEGQSVIESVPGYRRLFSVGERINAIYLFKTFEAGELLLIHAGGSLYRSKIYSKDLPEKIGEISDTRSTGFPFGDFFYILDGSKILRISPAGEVHEVGSEGAPAYVPTLYLNGSPYETRNLLTDSFIEKYEGYDAASLAYGTPELTYRITDRDLSLCEVSGVAEGFTGAIYVPGSVIIGGRRYTVAKIGNYAFRDNLNITDVIIGEGVEVIGRQAFTRATALKRAVIAGSVHEIQYGAFHGCSVMNELFVGAGMKTVGEEAITSCYSLDSVFFGGDERAFSEISGSEHLSIKEIAYDTHYTAVRIELPLHADAISVERLTVGDADTEFETVYDADRVKSIILDIDTPEEINNKALAVYGTERPLYSSFSASATDSEDGKIRGTDAILHCRTAELFDGRVFLTGNDALSNTVFFSARDKSGRSTPLYFGALNYFNDGVGKYPVTALLSVRDTLAVFKSGDDGSGSIFYHTPADTGDDLMPRIYPVSSVHSGLCALGGACNFLDDPVFLSVLGLSALERQPISLERSIAVRSHNVNLDLLKEDLSSASLVEWLGYLCIGVGGNIYLADSRSTFLHETGSREYEWFVMKGVGTYSDAARGFRFDSSSPREDVLVHELAESVCRGTVFSTSDELGSYSFCVIDGQRYAVYPTGESVGGDFYPARTLFSDGRLLLFGNDRGDVCIFNNDMRGVAPERISTKADFDEKSYKARMGSRIHPDFYSFDGHAPTYLIKTAFDDCNIPHLAKSTVKHSLVIKCKSYTGTHVSLSVGTDRRGFTEPLYLPGGELDFDQLDFSSLTFFFGDYFSLPVNEKEKNWVEKQIAISSDGFASPIGIYSITYRYTVKGKIKRS
ncbi:MAG: leucine-rich repeat protein [Clostridia bacterium]|nr:leucine-rich repeat protein [Clostridia bacterium]